MFNLNLNKEKDDFANQMLDNYPDFDNILIKWNGEITELSTSTINDFKSDFTVGDTPINSIGETLNRYTVLNGSIGTSANIGQCIGLVGALSRKDGNYEEITITYRVGLLGTLPPGKTVGKRVKIYTRPALIPKDQLGSGTNFYAIVKEISYNIRILHSDGTFADIGKVYFIQNGSEEWSGYEGGYGYNLTPFGRPGFSVGEFNGVTTVAGDRIVCDIYINGQFKRNGNYGCYFGIAPGYAGSLESPSRINGVKPIQISIE